MIISFLSKLLGIDETHEERVHDFGYLIVKVHEGSPSHLAGLQPFFDFIIKLNDIELTHDPTTLTDSLKNISNETINLFVFNIKAKEYRNVCVRKSSSWEGESALGIMAQFSNISVVETLVWHVLEVYHGSPADVAGLRPYSDYIIGHTHPFEAENSLYEFIENSDKVPIKFSVYNNETDAVREVTVTPNRDWQTGSKQDSGNSLLGCGIGFGYLHRIPSSRKQYFDPGVQSDAPLTSSLPSVIPEPIIQSHDSNPQIQLPYSEDYSQPIYTSPPYNLSYSQDIYTSQQYDVIHNPYHYYQEQYINDSSQLQHQTQPQEQEPPIPFFIPPTN